MAITFHADPTHPSPRPSPAHALLSYRRPPPPTSPLADATDPASTTLPTRHARYQFTKLCSLFLARRLAALPAAAGIVVNCVHPGLCASDLTRDYGRAGRWAVGAVAWPAEEGARVVSLADAIGRREGAACRGGRC